MDRPSKDILFYFYFIYLFMRDTEGEAGSMHREPDVGFDPGSPGSCPGQAPNRCATQGSLQEAFLNAVS